MGEEADREARGEAFEKNGLFVEFQVSSN